MENWKTVEGFTRIEISDHGNVRSSRDKKLRYKTISKSGYWVTQISVKNKVHTLPIHRLVAKAFLPQPSEELIAICSKEHHKQVLVNHKDGDKLNNLVDNLEWCTFQHNVSEAIRLNLVPQPKGELNGRAKLSEKEVHKICQAYEEGMMPQEAIKVFGISRQQATKIRSGHSWQHISELYSIKVNKRTKKIND